MPMPTTRRGRFIFYRDRAQRRHTRIWKDHWRPSLHGHGFTSRGWDTTGFRFQFPKSFGPKYVQSPRPTTFWLPSGVIKPKYKLFPFVPVPFPKPFWWGPKTHWTSAHAGFWHRRIHHVPPLKHVPRLPYRYPISVIGPFMGYPFTTYPSGQPNPRGWLS